MIQLSTSQTTNSGCAMIILPQGKYPPAKPERMDEIHGYESGTSNESR